MINNIIIKQIFNRTIDLKTKKQKEELSHYTDFIPMYDIYTDSIYPISSEQLNFRLLTCHYRFITDEVKQWIINKLEDINKLIQTNTDEIKHTTFIEKKQKYINNIGIINNYDLNILEKTSYETLYRYSPDLGLSISICKRNSFNPFITHLTPYYTKIELIRLGMNNKLIKHIDTSNLIDKKLHFSICKKVYKNDISYLTILDHMNNIINNNCIGWIQYYSMTGSYIFNKILRESLPINQYMYNGLSKIIDTINKCTLPRDYYFYRFVWDDDYINKLKIGDVFTDNGFISTTRDPFYSPGIKKDFGLILVRINIPKNTKGIGILLENFSLFPKEEEFLIMPYTKLKLISKNTNTTYYHTNEAFEKLIKKRYEFKIIDNIINKQKFNILDDNNIPSINIETLKIDAIDRYTLFTQFKKKCDEYGQYIYKKHIFITEFFDSTTSYQNLYYNKTKDGMIHTCYINGNPILTIELGEQIIINYLKSKCYYDNNSHIDNIPTDELNDIISMYCKLFGYKNAVIYFEYNNFTEFKDNYTENKEYLSTNLYCKTLYDYIKNKNTFKTINYYTFNYGFWKIDKIIKMTVPKEIMKKLPDSIKHNISWGELFIEIIEKHFIFYKRMEEWFNMYHDNLFKNTFYQFNPIVYLKKFGYIISDIPSFDHINTRDRGDMFRIIYNETARRI